jgi:homoaconitase/3-isopropylmalate dehydratase large subunit
MYLGMGRNGKKFWMRQLLNTNDCTKTFRCMSTRLRCAGWDEVCASAEIARMVFFIGPQADPDAEYAEVHEISLADVDSMVALYPSPDNGMIVEGF